MATLSPPFGIRSFCLNSCTVETLKCTRVGFIRKKKIRTGQKMMEIGRKHFYGETAINAIRPRWSLKLNKIAAARVSMEQSQQVKIDELKKASAYLFRTKSGALVKVYVRKKNTTHVVKIDTSSLELYGDNTTLVMLWGVFKSDSSCFLPLEFQNSSQDSQTHIIESPFMRNSRTDFTIELEFDGKESLFFLSFVLKSYSKSNPSGEEIKSHRDMKFVVPVGFSAGSPLPLGLSFAKNSSMNFAFFARNSRSVVLCLFDDTSADKPALELDLDPYINRTGDVWHASIEGGWNFVGYGYRCRETMNLQEHDVDDYSQQILLDPHTKIIWKHVSDKYLGRLSKEPSFDWGNDKFLDIPMEKLVVYRLNVARFTQHRSSELPTDVAGTFSGLTEKIHHLKSLGMNAILLEPIFSFDEQKGPYFTFHFFSPMNIYGPSAGSVSAITSMKEMVKRFHADGIEVLLEVVFTHTADSGALQGIDDWSYYYENRNEDLDSENYLNCNYPVVQQMILDSLRYWVTEFHVDGFCFINASSLLRGFHGEYLSRPPLVEAIAFDPLLSKTKIIADFWDPRGLSPEETRFPHWKRWAEINSKFCRDVRNFLRGQGVLSDLATRLCGSGDIFTDGRGPAFSFNFISRNSGLPLVDLVSFSNPELASELTWNCGEEGPTNKSAVLERRLKQIRNFLFVLYVSLGVPILNMGDECGVSAGGSPLYESRKPFDWNAVDSAFGTQITQFISFMSSLRARRSDILQRSKFLKPENIEWCGNDQSPPKWEDPTSKFLAVILKAEDEEEDDDDEENPSFTEQSHSRGDLFVAFNASESTTSVILPSLSEGTKWRRLVDTALPFPGFFSVEGEAVTEQMAELVVYEMKSYSCTLFEACSFEG